MFKGYINQDPLFGTYTGLGKGTPNGDTKDKAMRHWSDCYVGEIVKTNSSSYTSFITIRDKSQNNIVKIQNYTYSVLSEEPLKCMLSRNGKIARPLNELTKNKIIELKNSFKNIEFFVGDMPFTDGEFINLLRQIDANFSVFHTGINPRISV